MPGRLLTSARQGPRHFTQAVSPAQPCGHHIHLNFLGPCSLCRALVSALLGHCACQRMQITPAMANGTAAAAMPPATREASASTRGSAQASAQAREEPANGDSRPAGGAKAPPTESLKPAYRLMRTLEGALLFAPHWYESDSRRSAYSAQKLRSRPLPNWRAARRAYRWRVVRKVLQSLSTPAGECVSGHDRACVGPPHRAVHTRAQRPQRGSALLTFPHSKVHVSFGRFHLHEKGCAGPRAAARATPVLQRIVTADLAAVQPP